MNATRDASNNGDKRQRVLMPWTNKRMRDDTTAIAIVKENETLGATRVDRPSASARKPSHVLSKEERTALADEAIELEALLDALRQRVGLPTRQDVVALDNVRAKSRTIDDKIAENDAFLARINSAITHELLESPVNPMATFIHLPCDMVERRGILRGMQHLKLRRAREVATERLYYLDPTQPYMSEESCMVESGEYQYTRFEILQLRNFKTARQLHDVFVLFLYNLEINVTEMLGQLTLREDMEEFNPTIWNHRMVTIVDNVGVPEELNLVGFAQFYPFASETQSPMGIVTYETVNVDDLYPYLPMERTCKDVQTAFMACEVPGNKDGEVVVVFKQFHFVVQLPPAFPVAPRVLEQLEKNIPRWPIAINKYLQEYVVPE